MTVLKKRRKPCGNAASADILSSAGKPPWFRDPDLQKVAQTIAETGKTAYQEDFLLNKHLV